MKEIMDNWGLDNVLLIWKKEYGIRKIFLIVIPNTEISKNSKENEEHQTDNWCQLSHRLALDEKFSLFVSSFLNYIIDVVIFYVAEQA